MEFSDDSISLSNCYTDAVIQAGGIPVIIPCTKSKKLVAEYVRRADGVLLTGGDDVQPKLYAPRISRALAKTVTETEPERDVMELQIVDEVFRQHKPLLAICRGHQILNVALGGTLIVDIATQVPKSINHRQMERKCDKVHEVTLTPDSLLAKITGRQMLGVNSTHHQSVDRLAKLLRITAKSSDGVVEAMELKNEGLLPYLLSVQFHPERLVKHHREFQPIFRSFVWSCASVGTKKI